MEKPILPKKPAIKPLGVKISEVHTVPLPTPMGQMAILILGLGDDMIMYKYDGPNKQWQEQL